MAGPTEQRWRCPVQQDWRPHGSRSQVAPRLETRAVEGICLRRLHRDQASLTCASDRPPTGGNTVGMGTLASRDAAAAGCPRLPGPRQRLVECRMHGEDPRKTCDLEYASHAAGSTDEVQGAAVRTKSLGAVDQHAEHGGIDEGHRREVDDDPVGALVDALQEHLAELGRRVEIDLAGERHQSETVRGSLELYVKLWTVFHALLLGMLGDPRRPFWPT